MAKQWYIIHTYSGHEAKAMQALLERAKAMGKEDEFDEVLIPEETVVEMVKGTRRTSKRKYFPGYIIVRMELNDETWHIVRGTPKITGFVGGDEKPPPISDDEVARMTLILRGRRFGFSLEEIRQWLLLYDKKGTRAQLEEWVRMADRQIANLTAEHEQLGQTIDELRSLRDETVSTLD